MKARYVWAVLLLLVGIWLLLGNLGLVPGASWGVFWSLVLIVLGVILIAGVAKRGQGVTVVNDSIPLGTASRGRVTIKHGAGRLQLQGADGPGHLIWGAFGGGVKKTIQQTGDLLDVELAMDATALADRVAAFSGQGSGYEWNLGLNSSVPVELKLETGASDQYLDLSRTRVAQLDLSTGASSTVLIMPAAAGFTEGRVNSGAASVKITIPPGVAAKITGAMGLGALKVDESRFPRSADGWESPDFASAANRVQLAIEGGVGSVEIR